MPLSAERRNEVDRAQNTKAMRVTLYELGIFIGLLYLDDKAGEIWPHPQNGATILFPLVLLIGLIIARWREWKKLCYLEDRLHRDEDEKDRIV